MKVEDGGCSDLAGEATISCACNACCPNPRATLTPLTQVEISDYFAQKARGYGLFLPAGRAGWTEDLIFGEGTSHVLFQDMAAWQRDYFHRRPVQCRLRLRTDNPHVQLPVVSSATQRTRSHSRAGALKGRRMHAGAATTNGVWRGTDV